MAKSAKNALIRLLARRNYFTFEVRAKLIAKEFPKEEVEKALSEMAKLGYLNDVLAERAFVKQQLSKGYGARAIGFKMRIKGGSLTCSPSFEEEREALRSFVARKQLKVSDHKSRQKLFAKLMQRGFSQEVISNYLSD